VAVNGKNGNEAGSSKNGHNGNSKRRKIAKYPIKVIATAIAMLCAGESVQAVSDKLSIPHPTISDWKAKLIPKGEYSLQHVQPKKEVIESLLGEYLEEILRMALIQVKLFQDETWIRSQNAADISTLHGTVVDKGFRILEAAEIARQRSEGEQKQLPAASSNVQAELVSEPE